MNRTFWISASLAAALLAPATAWEASVSQNIAVAIVKETIGLSPTGLTFSPEPPGVSSAAQTVTVSNTGAMAFPLLGVGLAGNNAADFTETNNCPASIAVGASCLISVTFAPASVGAMKASVVVSGPGGGTYTVALSGTAASLSGTTIPAAAALGDASGNVWTVSGGQIYRNGVVDPITGGVTLVLYYHGTIYQQANGAWYQLTSTSWPAGGTGWTWLSSGDPRTASASGALVPSASDITDASRNVYTMAGGQIYRNGIIDPVTANVTLLLYYNGAIYQQTSYLAWYQLTSTSWPAGSNGWTWLSSGDPRTGSGSSCTGVAVTPASGIQNAVNTNPAGTTFCLAAGTYNEAVTPKANDVFQGANIGQTILDGQNTLLSAFASNGSAITGVTIKYLTVRHYTGFAAIFPSCCNGATGWLIDTVEVANNSQEGFDLAPNTTIQNSLIHNNGLNAIHAANGGSSGVVANNNDIYNNNTTNTNPCTGSADTSAIKMSGNNSAAISFTNNYDHDNSGNGLWFDLFEDQITISGNYFAHNIYNGSYANCGSTGAGTEVGLPHSNTTLVNHVFNNYFLDNGAGGNVWIVNSSNWEVYNNTMVVTNVGSTSFSMYDEGARTDQAQCGTSPQDGRLCLVKNNSFHNNFIASTGDLVFYGADGTTPGANWAGNGNSWTNNTYYLPSPTSVLFNASGTLQTFAQWQAAGKDSGSTAIFNGGTLPSGVGTRGGFVCNPKMGTVSGGLGLCP